MSPLGCIVADEDVLGFVILKYIGVLPEAIPRIHTVLMSQKVIGETKDSSRHFFLTGNCDSHSILLAQLLKSNVQENGAYLVEIKVLTAVILRERDSRTNDVYFTPHSVLQAINDAVGFFPNV
jgi:hypothetical protein